MSFSAFKDFDAVVGEGIVRSGDVDGKIEIHFVETIVDAGGRENAGAGVFDTKGFTGGGEVLQNPFGGFAGVTGEEDFDVVASVVDETFDDTGEKVGGEIFGFATDAIGTKFMHFELL